MKEIYALTLAMAIAGAASAQNYKSTGTTKYVLLEEGTGTWCQYCPDGQVVMLQILANSANQNRVNAVALHNGSSDAMAVVDINTMLSAYTPNWPNGGVDRVLNTQVNPNKVFMSRSYWQQYITSQLAVAPGFQIDLTHSYNNTTRALSINVKAKAITAQTGNYNINCYVVEDSVTGGTGYAQVNFYDNQPGHPFYGAGNPITNFTHRHVARINLGGVWGTTGVIANNAPANGTYTKNYTYTLPGTSSYTRWKIVAFVTKDDPTVPNNRIVKNSVEADVTPGIPTGISEVNEDVASLTLYPNPATDNIYVAGIIDGSSDVALSVMNSMGQVVLQKNYENINTEFNTVLSTEGLAAGMYYVTISANGVKKTERVVVSK